MENVLTRGIGQMIETLRLMYEIMTVEKMEDSVEYL